METLPSGLPEQIADEEVEIIAEEPPPSHANIEGWPWLSADPELQKAQQLELASRLASASELVPL
jgi:hypothetical protein